MLLRPSPGWSAAGLRSRGDPGLGALLRSLPPSPGRIFLDPHVPPPGLVPFILPDRFSARSGYLIVGSGVCSIITLSSYGGRCWLFRLSCSAPSIPELWRIHPHRLIYGRLGRMVLIMVVWWLVVGWSWSRSLLGYTCSVLPWSWLASSSLHSHVSLCFPRFALVHLHGPSYVVWAEACPVALARWSRHTVMLCLFLSKWFDSRHVVDLSL